MDRRLPNVLGAVWRRLRDGEVTDAIKRPRQCGRDPALRRVYSAGETETLLVASRKSAITVPMSVVR